MGCRLRVFVALLLTLLAFANLHNFVSLPLFRWSDESGAYPGSHPSNWIDGPRYDLERLENDVLFAIASLINTFPELIVSFVVFSFVARRRHSSNAQVETVCRKCGHILRGLTSPRCPECGERV